MTQVAIRRNKMIEKMGEQSILVLHAGATVYESQDESYPFVVNRHFYYFTDLNIKNAILVLFQQRGIVQEHLFIERYDELHAKWMGKTIMPDEATAKSAIASIHYIDEFQSRLSSWISFFETPTLYLDLQKQVLDQITLGQLLATQITTNYPHVIIKNAHSLMASLRLIKSEEEIGSLKQAIAITKLGIERMMREVKPGLMEYQLEAEFNHAIQYAGCKKTAFKSIIAGGINATVLHYSDNSMELKPDTLVLTDLGASYQLYNADISRTFPVSGVFTERQKQLYAAVLEANELVIANAVVGTTLTALNQLVVDFYQTRLATLGLLENDKKVFDYYFHRVSHMLGLDTHDVNVQDYVLEEGNVITVEPGLYIENEKIGIRIEDDILITKNGPVNLSKEIIKSVEDIENFMKHK